MNDEVLIIDRSTKLWAVAGGAVVTGVVLALLVHIWGGDEVALCDGAARTSCPIGSGASWTWTSALLFAPLFALGGFLWTDQLHRTNQLGPFAYAPIPDWEELLEGIAVLVAALMSYLVIRVGPKTPMVDTSWMNSLLSGHLGTEAGADLVPSRRSWFVVGAILSAPFAFSFGSAVGREWFRWKRRRGDESGVDDGL